MKTLPALILAGLSAAVALPAGAQGLHCGPRDVVTERLDMSYGERLTGGGFQNADSVIELWVSPETGSWTILLSRADGQSCIMAAGTDWHGGSADETLAGLRS